jgi:iron complex outermembrane receptor protein
MQKFLFFSCMAIMATLQVAAQRIQGTVQDTGHIPVPLLRIYLSGTQKHTVTSPNGTFALNDVKPGTYKLLAAGTGYKTLEQTITVQDSTTHLSLTRCRAE